MGGLLTNLADTYDLLDNEKSASQSCFRSVRGNFVFELFSENYLCFGIFLAPCGRLFSILSRAGWTIVFWTPLSSLRLCFAVLLHRSFYWNSVISQKRLQLYGNSLLAPFTKNKTKKHLPAEITKAVACWQGQLWFLTSQPPPCP